MGQGKRNTLTPEQELAIRYWVWGNPDKVDKEGKKTEGAYYYSTYTELAKDVGVDNSQIPPGMRPPLAFRSWCGAPAPPATGQ